MRCSKLILLCSALILPGLSFSPTQINAQARRGGLPHLPGIHFARGAKAAASSLASQSNIPYNGGAVLPSTTTYAIWWGKLSDFPPDAVKSMDDFLGDLDASDYLRIADQYMFGQKTHTRFGGNFFDDSAPTEMPFDAQGNDLAYPEVFKVLAAHGLKPDPTAIYFVYTSNYPAEVAAFGACADHSFAASPDGTLIHFAYMPNASGVPGICGTDWGDPFMSPNDLAGGTSSLANFTAHEFMETITDPNFDAWNVPGGLAGGEVGDQCAWIFTTRVPLKEDYWKIQMIWSNEEKGCVTGAVPETQVFGSSSNPNGIVSFTRSDAPYGMFGFSMNQYGAIAGYYTDSGNEYHAFLRDSQGVVSNIDPPGTGPGYYGGAQALGINAHGEITGNYGDVNFVIRGFIRDAHGTFLTVDVPDAATAISTDARAINENGTIVGTFLDANSGTHGFIRDKKGLITTFDAPGAGTQLYQGTRPLTINEKGTITGFYLDTNSVLHGFVRDEYGNLNSFDVPGASTEPGEGTYAQSINDDGEIAGYFTDAQFRSHGYVRDKRGLITTFDAPRAVFGTFAYGINTGGSVAGYYSDEDGYPRGFVRDKQGNFKTIDTAGKSYGTVLRSLNDKGETAGYHTTPTP
jgi:hypothetical protein